VNSSDGSVLQHAGWERYDGTQFLDTGDDAAIERALAPLSACCASLPADFYAPQSNRCRRHARAVYLPWTDTLTWVPSVDDPERGPVMDYRIDNADFAGVKRQFAALSPEVLHDPLVQRIVRFDLEQTRWFEPFRTTPLHVGVGCVMLTVREPGEEAAATPNVLHQDGGAMSFGFIHLIFRRNVVGAVNYIASPRCAGFLPHELSSELIKSEFTLEQPLESFAVHDARVSHHVSALRMGNEAGPAERGVMLVGIAPLVRQL
jgi:hypothetical protein